MTLLLVFSLLLLVAVLLSDVAHRTVLSAAVLFLVAGMALGSTPVGVLAISAQDPLVSGLAEGALFATLFTDGLRSGFPELRRAWRLPGRALMIGLPLTFALTTLFAHLIAGLPWLESFLLGAALSPTDPVFAAAIVGRKEIPFRLRNLLNVESGLNDGLTLPVVIVLLAVAGSNSVEPAQLVAEVVGGVAIGVGVPYLAIQLERIPWLSATVAFEPLNALAIGLIVLATAELTHANVFLAGFSAGITIASLSRHIHESFEPVGDRLAELLKLAALLVFGALVSPSLLASVGWRGFLFAAAALFLARPLALGASLIGSRMPRRERVAAAWFGPKGFASVVYSIMILDAGLRLGDELFHIAALVVAASIVAHSSTDVLVARWFTSSEPGKPGEPGEPGADVVAPATG